MVTQAMCNAARRTCFILTSAVLCFHLFLHQSQAFKSSCRTPRRSCRPRRRGRRHAPKAADGALAPAPGARARRGEARRAPAAAAPANAASSSPGGPAAHAPAAARAPSEAPAPDSGRSGGAALIKSSPAVPVPRGVTDTATVLPMPAPGQKRQEVGAATSVGAGGMLLLMLGFAMMASFGLY